MMQNDPSFAVEKVFVTYASEADQRKCLRVLTVGLIDSLTDSGEAPKFEGRVPPRNRISSVFATKQSAYRQCTECARSIGAKRCDLGRIQ